MSQSARARRSASLSITAAALVMVAAWLIACGGTQRSSTPGSSGRDSAAGARAPKPLTKALALVFARAVNLTSADVPGFTSAAPRKAEGAIEKRLEGELRRCAGRSLAGETVAAAQSQSFQLKRGILDLGVSSEVGVARTPAAAAGELAAIRGERVRGCFSRYLQAVLQSQHYRGTTPGRVSISTGTPPAPGAAGSFGWRITATFSVRRISLPLYVDILGFVVGPARVTLVSSGALRPFPAPIQQRLYALLLARASAHRL